MSGLFVTYGITCIAVHILPVPGPEYNLYVTGLGVERKPGYVHIARRRDWDGLDPADVAVTVNAEADFIVHETGVLNSFSTVKNKGLKFKVEKWRK